MAKMNSLSLDLETFSDVDLGKCGVYKYSESPAFEIILFGYSVDGGPVQVVDLACGEQIPDDILDALTDDTVLKWAFKRELRARLPVQILAGQGPQPLSVP
jgi:DNA polymerase